MYLELREGWGKLRNENFIVGTIHKILLGVIKSSRLR